MNWLGHIPFHLAWLPSLSWAAIIWLALFGGAAAYAGGLTGRAWHGYLALIDLEDADGERYYALGQAIARTCGTIMVTCGIAVGLIASSFPPAPPTPMTPGTVAYVLVFLAFAAAMLVQTVALEQSQRAALDALRRRAAREQV